MVQQKNQSEYWNGAGGKRWTANAEEIDSLLSEMTRHLFEASSINLGDTVLDVGCGAGATTFLAAKFVGCRGSVIGVDISGQLLEMARARAYESKCDNVKFIDIDAEQDNLGASLYDQVVSRFGLMFFRDTKRAFDNISNSLRSRGHFTFICWRRLEENPWMDIAYRAMMSLTSEIPDIEEVDTPGPFRFANRDKIYEILKECQFSDIEIISHNHSLNLGCGTSGVSAAEAAATRALKLGPAARFVEASPHLHERAVEIVAEAFASKVEDNSVRLDAGTWIVHATNKLK